MIVWSKFDLLISVKNLDDLQWLAADFFCTWSFYGDKPACLFFGVSPPHSNTTVVVMLVQLCTLVWGSGGGAVALGVLGLVGGPLGLAGCARVGGGGGRAPQTPEWPLPGKRGALFSPAHPENPGNFFS